MTRKLKTIKTQMKKLREELNSRWTKTRAILVKIENQEDLTKREIKHMEKNIKIYTNINKLWEEVDAI